MQDALIMLGVLVAWFALQVWVLPRAGRPHLSRAPPVPSGRSEAPRPLLTVELGSDPHHPQLSSRQLRVPVSGSRVTPQGLPRR
jgi:hypothetical protein